MSEDRELTELLRAALPDDVRAPADGAGRAVRSARRRTGGAVAAAAGMVAVLALGVPAALSSQGIEAAPVPAATPSDPPAPVPTSAPSETPAPVASVDATAVPSAPQSPAETSAAASAPPPEPSPSAEEPGPVPVLQVRETEQGATSAGELTGHSPVEGDLGYEALGGPASWRTAWCGGGVSWEDEARTGWSAQSFFGGDSGVTVFVASYRDEAAAAGAVESVYSRAAGCSSGPVPFGLDGTSSSWIDLERSDVAPGTPSPHTDTLGAQYRTGAAWLWTPPDPVTGEPDDDLTPGQVVSVVRQGRVVAMAVFVDDYSLGATVGAVAGDTRPGAARVGEGEDPQAEVRERVATTRSQAETAAARAIVALR